FRSFCFLTLASLAAPSYAGQFGQQPPPSPAIQPVAPVSTPETTTSDRREAMNDQKDWHFIGHVEMDRDPQGLSKIYADDVWLYMAKNRGVATATVLPAQGPHGIPADHAEYNTKDTLGTFYTAWGMAAVTPPVQRPAPGGLALPPVTGQENVIIFFGEKVE